MTSGTSNQYKALDLFCGGGGASMGLHQAGFDVFGVDIKKQRHYPFKYICKDVLDLDIDWIAQYDVVWASPPCQRYTRGSKQSGGATGHPDLITPVREMLAATGRPYIIENVPSAPLDRNILLCGSMFGLKLIRHRYFESNVELTQPPHDEETHHPDFITVAGNTGGSSKRDGSNHRGTVHEWRGAMEIDWLTTSRLREAIPPAYSKYIGQELMRKINR